jgi:hypothetical protein
MWITKQGFLDWEINNNKERKRGGDYGMWETEGEESSIKRLMLKQMFSSRIMAAVIVNENLVPSRN